MSAQFIMIGNKLKDARIKAGLTQQQVSEILDINQAQLSFYETGAREISITQLEKLASLYGYAVDFFVNEEKTMVEPDFAIAFRAEEVTTEDLKTIAWVKEFINNLCILKELE